MIFKPELSFLAKNTSMIAWANSRFFFRIHPIYDFCDFSQTDRTEIQEFNLVIIMWFSLKNDSLGLKIKFQFLIPVILGETLIMTYKLWVTIKDFLPVLGNAFPAQMMPSRSSWNLARFSACSDSSLDFFINIFARFGLKFLMSHPSCVGRIPRIFLTNVNSYNFKNFISKFTLLIKIHPDP